MRHSILLGIAFLALSACGSSSRTARDDGRGETAGADVATGPVEAELRRFPGVDVRETADGVEVRVRGDTSFLGGQEPLYVVDGVRINPGMGGALVGVRRADIVDVRVLKSASETSVYGPQGANGVVVITTRNARR